MNRYCTTRTQFGNSRYPCLLVGWWQDEDQNGWAGVAQLWNDGKTKVGEEHHIHLRQGQPLGGIYIEVDEVAQAGCWSMASFEGAGITERDLQWATLFAREAIQRKMDFLQKEEEEDK
jgi:hypothetical protein